MCKRSFIYQKRQASLEDEYIEDTTLVDYKKGEAFIILEEFVLTLKELPQAHNKLIVAPLGKILVKSSLILQTGYNDFEGRIFVGPKSIELPQFTVFQVALGIHMRIDAHNYEQVSFIDLSFFIGPG